MPDSTCSDELGKQAIVPLFVSNLSGDDGGMHLERIGEADDGHRRRLLPYSARLPNRSRNQRFLGTFVGLRFPRVVRRASDVTQGQIVHECRLAIDVHMPSDMCELVQ